MSRGGHTDAPGKGGHAYSESAGGGVSTVTATDATITVGGTAANPTVGVNLANANTWTVAQLVTVDDAGTATVVDLWTLTHTSSGTPAANFGAGILFRGEDASGNGAEDLGRCGFAWTDATAGSEDSAFRIWLRAAGAALGAAASPSFSFTSTGGLVDSTTTGLNLSNSGTDAPITITGRRNAGSSTSDVIIKSQNTRSAGTIVEFRNVSTVLTTLDYNGLWSWIAGNEQTTVGAAGGASALPATPTKYLKVKDSGGTTLVIPAYAAA